MRTTRAPVPFRLASTFFALPTRAWELGIGAIVALAPHAKTAAAAVASPWRALGTILGLVLILFQIATQRSIGWLVSMNALSASVALYLCAMANFDFIIADYNLAHCAEAAEGAPLDLEYLTALGPVVIPAIDAALAAPRCPARSREFEYARLELAREASLQRNRLAWDLDWRAWSFREARLTRYLAAQGLLNP